MVRDVFQVSGFLVFDALGQIVQVVLNQAAPLAAVLVEALQGLLSSTPLAIQLGAT